jgi:hypothetical protein
MRYIAILLLGVALKVNGQQINPVPDYVFRNQMSVGRNAATDSIAYLSVGPKYGAVKGFMPPMVVDTALVTGSAKRNGLLIFSVQKNKFLYWDSVGVKWAEMAGTAGSAVTSTGTANYIPRFATASNLANSAIYQTPGGKIVIGSTTDTIKLFNVNGESKTGTLTINSNGQKVTLETYKPAGRGNNIFIGKADTLNTSGSINGSSNVALGYGALKSITDGYDNVAIGSQAMEDLTTGYQNMGIGTLALANVTSGFSNVSVGVGALTTLTTGYYNTAIGKDALNAVSTGLQNIGIGYEAGKKITTGDKNILIGAEASSELTTGSSNLALGFAAIQNITTASYNTGIGGYSLFNVKTTDYNVGLGPSAGQWTGTAGTYTKGNNNPVGSIFIGFDSRPQDSAQTNQIVIGREAVGYGSNTATLGNLNISSTYLRGETFVAGDTDNGDYKLQVSGNGWFNGSLTTSDPSGGTKKPWKLGEATTVSPTSPNRTIRVEIDGTVYYIHAKTTND